MPAYRYELERLRSAAAVTGRLADVHDPKASSKLQALATSVSRVGADADDDVESDDDEEGDDDEAGAARPSKKPRKEVSEDEEEDDGDEDEDGSVSDGVEAEERAEAEDVDEMDVEEALEAGGNPTKRPRNESGFSLVKAEAERRALAASMLSNKKRHTYNRVMAAVGHQQNRVQALRDKAASAAKRGDDGLGKAGATVMAAAAVGPSSAAPSAATNKAPAATSGVKRRR